jgi:peptidoglycan hydrolase CwlO-like protein
MKTRLEDKIKALEKEKSVLLEELRQLKEIVELSEKAKDLENEVNKLRKEVATVKDKIPQEFLEELGETVTLREEDEPPSENGIL